MIWLFLVTGEESSSFGLAAFLVAFTAFGQLAGGGDGADRSGNDVDRPGASRRAREPGAGGRARGGGAAPTPGT